MDGDGAVEGVGDDIERVVVAGDGGDGGGAGLKEGGIVFAPESLLAGQLFLGVGGFEGLQTSVGELHFGC